MNGDLISRSALLDEIYGDNRPEVYDGQDIANWQMECINSAPAVDAEHVRNGRWVEKGMSPNMLSVWECSECNLKLDGKTWPYCPNCGARMDAEVNR